MELMHECSPKNSKNEITKEAEEEIKKRGIAFTDHIWLWTEHIMQKKVRAQPHYNNDPPYGLMGFFDDQANRVIGYPIIRQIRIARFECQVEEPMSSVIKECTGTRGITVEDTRNYCTEWTSNGTSDACNYPEFQHQAADDLQTYTKAGRLGYYGGGGYVIRLQGLQTGISARIKELQSLQWIDKYTRAVFFEFSTYNANVNLFTTCSILMELIEGGGTVVTWRFDAVKLIQVGNTWDNYLVSACEVLFVISILFFSINELWAIKKAKCAYFTQYWNLLEISIILISVFEIAIYFYKYSLTTTALEEFNLTKGNSYLRMDYAVLYDQYYVALLGLLMFLCILKLIKLLQFNKRMDVLALTIELCWDELSYFFMAFAVIFFAFCALFYCMFCSQLPSFVGIFRSIETCFAMMIGKFEFDAMKQASPMSPILFFVFTVLNSMILINIMMAIILKAFGEVQEDLEKKQNKYDLMDYIAESLKKIFTLQPNSIIQVEVDETEKSVQSANGKDQNQNDKMDLPDKIDVLVQYIKSVYFDGTLETTNSQAMKEAFVNQKKGKVGSMFATKEKNVYASD